MFSLNDITLYDQTLFLLCNLFQVEAHARRNNKGWWTNRQESSGIHSYTEKRQQSMGHTRGKKDFIKLYFTGYWKRWKCRYFWNYDIMIILSVIVLALSLHHCSQSWTQNPLIDHIANPQNDAWWERRGLHFWFLIGWNSRFTWNLCPRPSHHASFWGLAIWSILSSFFFISNCVYQLNTKWHHSRTSAETKCRNIYNESHFAQSPSAKKCSKSATMK